MSVINFGATVSMLSAATPSYGWIVGYDLDGFLKQKDTSGVITQIGLGGTASITPTQPLNEVLEAGNNTGTYSILMGSQTVLGTLNGTSEISLDYTGSANRIRVYSTDGDSEGIILTRPDQLVFSSVNATSSGEILVVNNQIQANVLDQSLSNTTFATASYFRLRLSDNSLSQANSDIIESGTTYDTGTENKAFLHLNTFNSQTLIGVKRSVILGGSYMYAEESETVYVPQVVIRDGDKIKAGAGGGILEFNQYNDSILTSTNLYLTVSPIIGFFSSTSSSSHLSNKNGILVRDTVTSSTTPSSQSPVTFISTELSSVEAGVYNSVIIGGNNLSATTSNTVYLGNKVNINNNYFLPDTDGSPSDIIITDGSGNLYWGSVPTPQVTTFSLAEVLTQGNDSASKNIMLGTATSLLSGNGGGSIYLDNNSFGGDVLISTNNASLSESYLNLTQTDFLIYSPNTFNLTFTDATVVSVNQKGLEYAFDYSASFVTYSLVDKNYVDSNFLSQVDNTSIELNGSNQVSLKSSIDGNRQFNDSVTILGDLSVLGTTSTIYTENLIVEDNFITLNGTYSGPAIDSGIEVNLGDGTYSKIFWSSNSQYWNAGLSGSEMTIVTEAMNGLSQTDNKLGLGGVLSQTTQIFSQGYDLDIFDVGSMTITASNFLDNKVYSSSTNTSQQFNNGSNYYTRVDETSGTYSIIDITPGLLNLYNFDGLGNVGINFNSQSQPLGDGSTNNRIIVADDINQKGIVYRGDYTANFTTYSLVTKGYVDSVSGVQGENGLTQSISGNIGLGGTLTSLVLIEGNLKNFYINNLGRLVFTASLFIDQRVYSNDRESKIFSDGSTLESKVTWGNTFSRIFTTNDATTITSYDGNSSSGFTFTNTAQPIADGSSDNRMLITDGNQKGLVYTGDYTANFSTYSLVTKGYVDSAVGTGLTGSGTVNYLSKWTSSTGLNDSIIEDDNGFLGIGTSSNNFTRVRIESSTSSVSALSVHGSQIIYNKKGTHGLHILSNESATYSFWNNTSLLVNTTLDAYTNTGISSVLTGGGSGSRVSIYGGLGSGAIVGPRDYAGHFQIGHVLDNPQASSTALFVENASLSTYEKVGIDISLSATQSAYTPYSGSASYLYGLRNGIRSFTLATEVYGIYNSISGTAGEMTSYYTNANGLYNNFTGRGVFNILSDYEIIYGVQNQLTGPTFGTQKYGVHTYISGTGTNYGEYIDVSSNGIENYGLYIDSHSASTNYGIVVNRGNSIFNESGDDFDFTIKGQADSTLFFVDASSDSIGIGTTPSYKLEVIGTVSTTGFRMTNGSSNGYLLTSDSSGNSTWLSPTQASANFANTDLVFTGTRTHDTNGNSFVITTDGGLYNQSFFELNTGSMLLGNGVNGININNAMTTFNSGGDLVNFKIEGNTQSSLFVVNASNDNIGIGTNTPTTSTILDIYSTTKAMRVPTLIGDVATNLNPKVDGMLVCITAIGGSFSSIGFYGYLNSNWTKF